MEREKADKTLYAVGVGLGGEEGEGSGKREGPMNVMG